MKISSAKAKSRRTQNYTAGFFSLFGQQFLGLKDGDVMPRPMGQSGVDVIFSPAALVYFPYDIECKNVEKLSIVAEYNAHARQYERTGRTPLLIHSRNKSKLLVTLSFADFVQLLVYVGGPPGFVDTKRIHDILCVLEKNKGSWEAIQRILVKPEDLKLKEAQR